MGLIHDTLETVDAAYQATEETARETRRYGINEAIETLDFDRGQTYETSDPETAFIHFLGSKAFHKISSRVFISHTSRISEGLAETGRLPVLFEGVHRDGRRLPIEPEYARPWYTSLAIVEGTDLVMRSSVEVRHDINVGWNRPSDITVRRLGIVAKTATTRADLGNKEQVEERVEEPVITGDVLPMYLELRADVGTENETILFPAFDEFKPRGFLPHEVSGSGIGWRVIVSTLRGEMDFSRHLHINAYDGVPIDLTEADKKRYELIDKLVATLGITPAEQEYIDYLHDLPKLTAEFPDRKVAA